MKEVERHQVVVAVADKHLHVLVEAHPVLEVVHGPPGLVEHVLALLVLPLAVDLHPQELVVKVALDPERAQEVLVDRSDVVLVGRRQRRVRPLVGRAVELGVDRGQRGVVVPAQAALIAQELADEHGAVNAAVGPQHHPPVNANQV